MAERLLPLAAMEKIMKESGAERVAESAKTALKAIIEEKAEEISQRAITFAIHAGRKTVKSQDIILAVKEFR